MTEKDKMINGMIYDNTDPELVAIRTNAHKLCIKYNKIEDDFDPLKITILKSLLNQSNDVYLQGPIFFDYGINTSFGSHCYANYNFCVIDVNKVTIGNNVFFGPNVSLVTAIHPFIPEEREMYINNKGVLTDKEYSKPISIDDNCWICTNVVILPGVKIGKGVIIGAGSVVTKDIPDNVLAYGNPCHVIRKFTAEDSIRLKQNL